MNIIDILVIIAVFAAVAYIGYSSSKKVKNMEDYFVAGRSLGKIDAGLSLAATDFGGASLVGACAYCYTLGKSGALWSWAVVPAYILVGIFLIGKLQPLGLTTAAEYLGRRYDKKTRTLASVMHLCGLVTALSGQFIIAATSMNALLGIPQPVAYTIALVVVLAYTTAGGLNAVVKTDVFQFIIIIITIIAMVPSSLNYIGGWEAVTSYGFPDSFFGYNEFGVWEFISWILWGIFAFPTSQNYLQRVFASKDKSTAKFSFMFTASTFVFSGFMLMIVGMCAAVIMPGIEDTNSVFPLMLKTVLPTGLRGLALGGIFAAVMSSADSQIMSASTLFTNDIYMPYFNKENDEKKILRASRLLTVVICLASVIVGLFMKSIIDIVYIGGLFYSAAVFYPIVCGLFWKKGNKHGAFAGILAAVAMGALSQFYLTTNFTGILALPANITGSTVGLIVYIIVSLMTADKAVATE